MTHSFGVRWLALLLAGCTPAAPADQAVRPGIEVLLEDSTHLITGRRVGLLTNQTGRDRNGVSDLERLLDAGVEVTAIFAPEHGYRGVLDEELIAHGIDPATGTAIFSLYGNVQAPTAEMLREVEVVLVDLHDIGARPYTFISTALRTMESAAVHDVHVVVLDRPNPIGGVHVQGPVLDTAFSSFVGMLPVALRHGMTLGELARFGNEHLGTGADLTVVPAAGWTRDQWYDRTGLPWVRPSPSMPDLESATHYPGLVLFEATNLSVGRGTPAAFQVIGAPWLDAEAVVRAVAPRPGVLLGDTVVRPEAPPDDKYDGRDVSAVRLRVTDRERYDPVETAVALLVAIGELHGDSLTVRAARLAQLAGSDALWEEVERGASWEEIVTGWREPLAGFLQVRERYLIYE
jgi:uncharacterized protein YbbC (DUF1343 family)